MKQQKNRKKTASLLAVVFLFLLAAPVMAGAVERSTPKQEVVYVNLAADGSVADIYVVNIFDLDKTGQIIDYGDYTALRNMTTDDEILFEDETVRIQTEARKLYLSAHQAQPDDPPHPDGGLIRVRCRKQCGGRQEI